MVLAGGGVVLAYVTAGVAVNQVIAVHLGASTPIIIGGLVEPPA